MQEECECSALPRISGKGWGTVLVIVKKCDRRKYVLRDNIMNYTKIRLVNP